MDLADEAASTVAALRKERGNDIWLMGGGVLFRSLLAADVVDTVGVGIVPVLLGRGIPLLPDGQRPIRLTLRKAETFFSGIVLLEYDVRSTG